jgi:hypothetical protein
VGVAGILRQAVATSGPALLLGAALGWGVQLIAVPLTLVVAAVLHAVVPRAPQPIAFWSVEGALLAASVITFVLGRQHQVRAAALGVVVGLVAVVTVLLRITVTFA